MWSILLLVCSIINLSAAAPVDLQAKYPFSLVLFDQQEQYYGLHWNFTRSTERIYFAVNVSTTGWVGFGLSPDGQMPGSDVVIGWVSNAGQFFWDRYAEGRSRPPIDSLSQDWFLTNSEEENGYTILEFWRNFTSCDPQDRNIESSTARVVWSYSVSDPAESSGSDARLHDYMGSRSVNLIGGTTSANREFTGDEEFFDFTATNVTIPTNSTTYWCETFRTPQQFLERTHYINRISPVLTSHSRAYVHHMVVYLCTTPLQEEAVGLSMPCSAITPLSTSNLRAALSCRAGLLIGGWTVGGEDFFLPKGISYPIGGSRDALIEIHYDNPDMTDGVIDNSGMRIYYTTEPSEFNAGSIALGHIVTPNMIVPPGVERFTIAGICSADCTQQGLPPEGIRVFANSFHTHLAGRGVAIQHYRRNTECNVLEELEPIDQNLNYDFNYQQTAILPKEHLVLPGDILVLKCFYGTSNQTQITSGGYSTREEMCLSFIYYYPRPPGFDFVACLSEPGENSFSEFFRALDRVDPAAREQLTDPDQYLEGFRNLDWASNPELITSLEVSVVNSTNRGHCFTTNSAFPVSEASVSPGCSYQPPNTCGGPAPLTCCEQVRSGAPHTDINLGIVSFMLFAITAAVY